MFAKHLKRILSGFPALQTMAFFGALEEPEVKGITFWRLLAFQLRTTLN